jgi:hypothetical protein
MNTDFFKRDTNVARINEDGTLDDGSIHDGFIDDVSSKTNLKDAIRENALGPKKVQSDAGSVEQHSLQDQIAAERFLSAKEAVKKPGLGIKLTKLAPDGAVE